ncbi:MAG: gas vesicle protein [Candidatus Dormibacteraeota bacterium]|nr:gas vesicle protein [Candidatus Dormibacteraeota bacterium]
MPLRGVLGFAATIRDEADREYHDPSAVRLRLEEIAEARDAGLLSDEEAAQMELEAVQRLTWGPWTAPDEID